jgi:hypothetical protein
VSFGKFGAVKGLLYLRARKIIDAYFIHFFFRFENIVTEDVHRKLSSGFMFY